MWNRSQAQWLICFHAPKSIIDKYAFHVELVAQSPTSMHGSSECHTGYIYKRTKKFGGSDEVCDKLFAEAWELCQDGLNSLRETVNALFNENMDTRLRTRSRQQNQFSRF